MAMLENNRTNKLITFLVIIVVMSALGALVGKKGDKTAFAIGGAVVGLFIAPGVASWIIKPKGQ